MTMRRSLLAAWGLLMLALAVPTLGQEGFPLFTTDFPPEEFAARRKAVSEAIGADAFAVVQGAPAPPGYTRFRQSNDFYYLCGVEVPHAYLLYPGEDHGFRGHDAIIRSFGAELSFYAQVFGFQPADTLDPVEVVGLKR